MSFDILLFALGVQAIVFADYWGRTAAQRMHRDPEEVRRLSIIWGAAVASIAVIDGLLSLTSFGSLLGRIFGPR